MLPTLTHQLNIPQVIRLNHNVNRNCRSDLIKGDFAPNCCWEFFLTKNLCKFFTLCAKRRVGNWVQAVLKNLANLVASKTNLAIFFYQKYYTTSQEVGPLLPASYRGTNMWNKNFSSQKKLQAVNFLSTKSEQSWNNSPFCIQFLMMNKRTGAVFAKLAQVKFSSNLSCSAQKPTVKSKKRSDRSVVLSINYR